MKDIVEKWLSQCLPAVEGVVLRGGAMLPSEMLLFVALCHEKRIDLVVESGRKNGFSTEILCKTGDWRVESAETHVVGEADSRLAEQYGSRLTLHRGDGKKFVPTRIPIGERVAVLLDGPKNWAGCQLFEKIQDKVVFAGIHDVYQRDSKDTSRVNRGRTRAITLCPDTYFTDDPAYLERFGWLDKTWMDGAGYTSHSDFLEVSCVLAVLHGGRWAAGGAGSDG